MNIHLEDIYNSTIVMKNELFKVTTNEQISGWAPAESSNSAQINQTHRQLLVSIWWSSRRSGTTNNWSLWWRSVDESKTRRETIMASKPAFYMTMPERILPNNHLHYTETADRSSALVTILPLPTGYHFSAIKIQKQRSRNSTPCDWVHPGKHSHLIYFRSQATWTLLRNDF